MKSLITNLVALLIFILSYFLPFYNEQIRAMGLYALSGALTNWIAIHMLFEKVPFLYGSGIITERFEEFKSGIRNLIMTQFFTKENFEKFMNSSKSNLIKIESDVIMDGLDFDKVFTRLKQAIMESQFGSMLSMFGGEQALDPLKDQFKEKFRLILSEILEDNNFISKITKSSESNTSLQENVESIVDQRLGELTPLMVKNIIQDMIKHHLGWLVVWGGVFGSLIGLISTLL